MYEEIGKRSCSGKHTKEPSTSSNAGNGIRSPNRAWLKNT